MVNIIEALTAFVNKGPGLEFWDYRDVKAYRKASRRITKQLHDFRALASRVVGTAAIDSPITEDDLLEASRNAFSGRLTLTKNVEDGTYKVDYCTGQYWCVEYRAAACAVLAEALRMFWNEDNPREYGDGHDMTPNDWLVNQARLAMGRGIADRWFR
jgi:hypothetical protein